MSRYPVALIGAVMVVALAACSEALGPRAEEGGGAGFVSRKAAEERKPPKPEKGVVPDVKFVQLDAAKRVIKRSGFTPGELEGLGSFVIPRESSLVCTQDPAAGKTPPKGTAIDLVFDRKC